MAESNGANGEKVILVYKRHWMNASTLTDNDQPTKLQGADMTVVTDKDGHFRRQVSSFRNFVSADPNAEFPAQKGRYVLYVHYGCPWAHRTIIVRALKGLEEIIPLVESIGLVQGKGWEFADGADQFNGVKYINELYFTSDKDFQGRFTVPVLWDQKKGTYAPFSVVSGEPVLSSM